MEYNVGIGSDVGRKRSQNQDRAAVFPELGLFVVADGMGGHQGGETASTRIVEILPEQVRTAEAASDWVPMQAITHAIQAANHAIYMESQTNPDLFGMGTTTTALLFKDGKLTIGHVGDSRCYFFRPGAIWQVTRDHSMVQEKLRAGLITREQVKTDRMKNVITRSVGFEAKVEVELYEMTIREGDAFLICSDGLSGLLEDAEILKVVQERLFETPQEPQGAVNELIRQANENGGDDNISAILIQILASKASTD